MPPELNLTGVKPYHPSKRTCILWFKRINESVFLGKLPEINNYVIKKNLYFDNHPSWAYYYRSLEYVKEADNPYSKSKFIPGSTIVFSQEFPTKKFFIEIFAHELVHHYQFINGKPLGHGKSFFHWSKRFNSKGLNLAVSV